jgi:2-polyprenyl-3-methyl-5-hydroxy-6-metoxy-1,4-benzoquinol methylase
MPTNYYDKNAKQFLEDIGSLDMDGLYAPFLERVRKGGWILDAGCGPGRDLLNFSKLGYSVHGFDASVEMVRLARDYSASEVFHASFETWKGSRRYDGVWCSASLLHVPHESQLGVLRGLIAELEPNGVLYCSYKLGEGVRIVGERTFFDHTETSLRALLAQLPGMTLDRIWVSHDLRPGRHSERWVNAVVIREA